VAGLTQLRPVRSYTTLWDVTPAHAKFTNASPLVSRRQVARVTGDVPDWLWVIHPTAPDAIDRETIEATVAELFAEGTID
jgi:hypothetical protein